MESTRPHRIRLRDLRRVACRAARVSLGVAENALSRLGNTRLRRSARSMSGVHIGVCRHGEEYCFSQVVVHLVLRVLKQTLKPNVQRITTQDNACVGEALQHVFF